MIELTEQQLHALGNSEATPPRLVNPRTKETFVLLRMDEYERLKDSVDGRVPNYPAPDGVKLAAGWLVERAGFGKGYPGDGAPARLSTKHALALTNRGNASTADVIALARTVRDGVRTTFGIELTPEPILIGAAF